MLSLPIRRGTPGERQTTAVFSPSPVCAKGSPHPPQVWGRHSTTTSGSLRRWLTRGAPASGQKRVVRPVCASVIACSAIWPTRSAHPHTNDPIESIFSALHPKRLRRIEKAWWLVFKTVEQLSRD
jgi:hypothetical protein